MAGYIGSKASVVSSGAERKKVFTITTTTTSLTGLAYTPTKVHVFHNGIRLVDGTDYTATNGTSITLTNAAENGDEVVVVSYASFQTSDTVSASAGGTFAGDVSVTGSFTVDGGTIKLDGNYPVGTNNVALGNTALDSNVSGASNTAIGADALLSNSTGSESTAVGYQAGYSNTTGRVTAVGRHAVKNSTTAVENTGIGYRALRDTSTGQYNTAVGGDALISNTTASYNTALGYKAGYSNSTGQVNTYIGTFAGEFGTGNNNTYVGDSSGYAITTGSKNTILGRYNGNQGGLDIRTSSNNIVLSDGDGNPRVVVNSIGRLGVNRTDPGAFISSSNAIGSYCYESVAVNQSGTYYHFDFKAGATVVGTITSSGSSTSYNTTSDYRLKENVVELTGATERLKQLEPKRFNFIADADTTVDGFLAHEAATVVPEAVTGTHNKVDADGNPEYQGIDQSKLVPLLVATIQELEARITALEAN